jgi:hypothetical protein
MKRKMNTPQHVRFSPAAMDAHLSPFDIFRFESVDHLYFVSPPQKSTSASAPKGGPRRDANKNQERLGEGRKEKKEPGR